MDTGNTRFKDKYHLNCFVEHITDILLVEDVTETHAAVPNKSSTC